MAKTHSLKDWTLIVGNVPISGFSENDAFTFEPNSAEAWQLIVGADGEPVRSRIINDAGRLRIMILDVSASNDVLQAAKRLDEQTGLGQFPVMVNHNRSATKIVGAMCWVANNLPVAVARNAGSREWHIDSGNWKVSLGGILVPT